MKTVANFLLLFPLDNDNFSFYFTYLPNKKGRLGLVFFPDKKENQGKRLNLALLFYLVNKYDRNENCRHLVAGEENSLQ